MTVLTVLAYGFNWPAVYFGDLVQLDWRSQFNTDLVIHIILLAVWVAWREKFALKGLVCGFFCIFWGGMFGFPYLLYIAYQAKGNPKQMLLGVHHEAAATE